MGALRSATRSINLLILLPLLLPIITVIDPPHTRECARGVLLRSDGCRSNGSEEQWKGGGLGITSPPPFHCSSLPLLRQPSDRNRTPRAHSLVCEYQRFDGFYNNWANPNWGSVGSRLHRDSPSSYFDGVYTMNMSLPSARAISDLVFKGPSGIPHSRNCTTVLAFFSQVVAYEIMASTSVSCPLEIMKIPVPRCDAHFDPLCEGKTEIPFTRAKYDKETGGGINSPREQINERTAWIDGSFVYSTNEAWVMSMRSYHNGRLLEGPIDGYPPLNNPHVPLNNPPPPQIHRLMSPDRLFILGDSRVNENPGLLSFGLVLFRWHNYNADKIQAAHPDWGDEVVFQAARRFVIATLQKIIAYDFIPALLNGVELDPYTKYMPHVPPGISHAFAAAAFRFPHSIVPPAMFLRKRGHECEFRSEVGGFPALRLCQNWWNAQDIVREYSVDEIILGMASQLTEADDNIVVEDLRDYIFGPMHFTRLDVVSSSIMRGRDNGLPPYNVLRRSFGLPPKDWKDINPEFYVKNSEKMEKLKELYGGDISTLDSYVGGMLEGGDSGPGELFTVIIKDQFQRIRDADRFWYENKLNGLFTPEDLAQIQATTLHDIIKATTDISENMLQKNVFFWKDGDPCPQPFQVNNTGLEKCVPFMRFDHFTGNEVTYIFTLIGLACVPIVCFGIGHLLVKKRITMGWNEAFDDLSVSASVDDKESRSCYSVNAFEWLQEENVRQVIVEVDKGQLTVRKPRGRVLRKLVFATDAQIQLIHSEPRASTMHGPYVLITLPKTHDLVIRLPSDKHLGEFLMALSEAVRPLGGRVNAAPERNDLLLDRAETKERRQDRLDHFFREAYARTFDEHELCDSAVPVSADDSDTVLSETITRHELAQAMGMKESDMFVQRMFAVTAKQRSDCMSFAEFLTVLKRFTNASAQEKYRLLFQMCDIEGTGRVRRVEFADLIRSLSNVAGVKLDEHSHSNLVDSVLHRHGVCRELEYMNYEDFETIFGDVDHKRPVGVDFRGAKMRVNLKETASLSSFAVPSSQLVAIQKCIPKNIFSRWAAFLETYRQHTVIVFIFVAINILYFLERFWHYRYMTEHRDLRRVMGAGIAITRGAAGALSFCMALILLTVCRNLITIARETPLGEYIPFDSAITFHKIVAVFAAVWASIHTIGHCVNFYHVATQSQEGLQCLFQEAVFGSNFLPSISYWFYGTITGLTGIALVCVMSIIYVFALPCFMRRAYHAFRFTHLLNIAFYAITLLHGLPKLLDSPKFWYFVIGPIICFIIDRIIGMRQEYKQLQVLNAALLPSDIIYLQFKRPASFKFRSGQWVRVSTPAFSCSFNESHAFSLASAPQAPTLELYIKAVGPWTWKLRSEIMRAQANQSPYPLIHLNGPYGDGNQEWANYEVAILVGGGIGVTPYASTLSDLVLQTTSGRYNTVRCKKVYFLWVCPTHKNYEWFVDVLKNVEEHDEQNVLETHIFVTQFFHKFDLRTTMLYICEKHFRGEHSGVSMFTGLRAQNHFGRPNFEAFFRFIQSRHREQEEIGVFSCGPSALNEQISEGCSKANRVRNAPSFCHRFETF
ncbi:unnamed protein product [Caenorhabditis auriculariae]|uniref:NAD(P)H oxidase (H2O2-forming) n=1 Tax=Caenorhabditis auriculariae TaxID=2777116 RepID=A0A8S1HXH1_9PELO|nr:unnamed protein product [Caenorhabditis auriculariae]